MELDLTVRSQNSNYSKDSKPESCLESKHSKEILIPEKQHRQQEQHSRHHPHHHHHHQQQQQQQQQPSATPPRVKDDSNILMFTSCGQLLLGVILVVFGVLVLVHGASLGGSGAGLWAGTGALIAGALGVVATLATSVGKSPTSQQRTSGFSTAHLASSLIALALSNMAAITALTAVVRDSQRTPELTLLATIDEDGSVVEVEEGWSGLLASIGLLVASVAELLLSAYSCVTLTPKLCGCLRSSSENGTDGQLKTHNMIHQWVVAQNHGSKNQPIYVVQPVMPVHAILPTPYGMTAAHGKYPGGLIPAGTLPMPTAGYKMPVISHLPYTSRSSSQMVNMKQKRYVPMEYEDVIDRRRHPEGKNTTLKKMVAVGEDQVDLAHTYTGLDKRMSEEFISIAMDPDKKSKTSSSHTSEIGSGLGKTS